MTVRKAASIVSRWPLQKGCWSFRRSQMCSYALTVRPSNIPCLTSAPTCSSCLSYARHLSGYDEPETFFFLIMNVRGATPKSDPASLAD